MPKPQRPELDMFIDKRMAVDLNANRKVAGTLLGFDPFLNIVLDNAVDLKDNNKELGRIVIRGASIQHIEALEQIAIKRVKVHM